MGVQAGEPCIATGQPPKGCRQICMRSEDIGGAGKGKGKGGSEGANATRSESTPRRNKGKEKVEMEDRAVGAPVGSQGEKQSEGEKGEKAEMPAGRAVLSTVLDLMAGKRERGRRKRTTFGAERLKAITDR